MDILGAGFFLLNLDGTVTPGAGLAAAIAAPGTSGVAADSVHSAPQVNSGATVTREIPRIPLTQAFRLTSDQEYQFRKWLDLVGRRHRDLRWDKLAPLAPMQELREGKAEEDAALRLTYRKLEDAQGNLAAIAVFATDAAPGRIMARQLEEERHRHKLEIRDVLALAANPPETVGAFLDDAQGRLDAARKGWAQSRLESAKHDWDEFAAGHMQAVKPEAVWKEGPEESPGQRLFRELHMVKGNAGAFGFENLAAVAQESEDLLESLKQPSAASERNLARLTSSLTALHSLLEELRRAMKLIAGEGQDAMTRVLKWKLDRLVISTYGVDPSKLEPPLRTMVESTRRLAFLSPAYLVRKYRNLVERLAHNLGKQVNFRVTSNSGDIHPESFGRVDEAIVHILRNMVDHGIESPAEREAAGKGEAEIGFEYVGEEDRIFLRIRDNGRGMDPDAIAERGVALGLITRKEADLLDEVGKLGLIFLERFTTRREAGLVSGRGLGLALAARCVTDRGGNLYVYSRPGEGTRFAIELPHVGHKRLP